jgi:membrane protein YdbS with pleckstrin-like domain
VAPPPTDEVPHLPDPRARTLWTIFGAVGGGLLAALVGVLAIIGEVWPLAAALIVIGIAVGSVFGRAAWRRRTWVLAPRALELQRGVIVQRATTIPYERIQQIDVERGPIERLFGLAQLVVRTAAATTDANLYGLSPADADSLRERLLDLAGIDDLV